MCGEKRGFRRVSITVTENTALSFGNTPKKSIHHRSQSKKDSDLILVFHLWIENKIYEPSFDQATGIVRMQFPFMSVQLVIKRNKSQ
jgi:hypothetical protein